MDMYNIKILSENKFIITYKIKIYLPDNTFLGEESLKLKFRKDKQSNNYVSCYSPKYKPYLQISRKFETELMNIQARTIYLKVDIYDISYYIAIPDKLTLMWNNDRIRKYKIDNILKSDI